VPIVTAVRAEVHINAFALTRAHRAAVIHRAKRNILLT
jgi:hypothetical protein